MPSAVGNGLPCRPGCQQVPSSGIIQLTAGHMTLFEMEVMQFCMQYVRTRQLTTTSLAYRPSSEHFQETEERVWQSMQARDSWSILIHIVGSCRYSYNKAIDVYSFQKYKYNFSKTSNNPKIDLLLLVTMVTKTEPASLLISVWGEGPFQRSY